MAAASRPRTTAGRKRAPAKRAPKKAAAGSRGIAPADCRLDAASHDISELKRRIEQEGGVGARRLPRAARRQPGGVRIAADRQGRADAFPARSVRGAPQEARRRARQDRAVPRPGDRGHRAEGRLLDAERPPPARGDAPARRESDHRARRPEARDRLADPRAQHREGAQPARALARSDPHLPGPDRRGRGAPGIRFRLLPRGGGARDARGVLREERASSPAAPMHRSCAASRRSPTTRCARRSTRTKSTPRKCSSSTSWSPRRWRS